MPRRFIAIAAVLIASSCVSATRSVAANMLISPFRLPMLAPTQPHRDVTFTTADGQTLEGWLFEPQHPGHSQGLVVLLHGKDANRGHFAGDAARFTALGYSVLAYDQRAHGRSEGQWCTYGIHEVRDLQRALDQFAPMHRPAFLIGESMGAAVALEAAARDVRVEGVVAAASFSDLRTVARERAPSFMSGEDFDLAIAEAEARAGFQVDDVNPLRDVANIHVPTLLLHGTDDTFIAPQHSFRLRQALELAEVPHQLVTLEGVGHQDILLHEASWQVIATWFNSLEHRADALEKISDGRADGGDAGTRKAP